MHGPMYIKLINVLGKVHLCNATKSVCAYWLFHKLTLINWVFTKNLEYFYETAWYSLAKCNTAVQLHLVKTSFPHILNLYSHVKVIDKFSYD
jgi:hypothetical protein